MWKVTYQVGNERDPRIALFDSRADASRFVWYVKNELDCEYAVLSPWRVEVGIGACDPCEFDQ
jgi:hypothetical protein